MYKTYLKSEHWKNLRELKIKNKEKCELCGEKNKLNVHHMEYRNLLDVTQYCLRTLCEKCHKTIHLILNNKNPLNINSKDYCFAELQILKALYDGEKIKMLFTGKETINKIRLIFKRNGLKMAGLNKEKTIRLYEFLKCI
jgi:hypothetical protein